MQAFGNELEIKTQIGEKKRIINICHANMYNAKVSVSPRPWDETPDGRKMPTSKGGRGISPFSVFMPRKVGLQMHSEKMNRAERAEKRISAIIIVKTLENEQIDA